MILTYIGYALAVVAIVWMAYERGFSRGCYYILNKEIDEKTIELAQLAKDQSP